MEVGARRGAHFQLANRDLLTLSNEMNTKSRKENMKTNEPNNEKEESTYALLVRSEEKKRIVTEVVVYGVIVLSALAAIWEFGEELSLFQS
jgi:hypothetical protein